MIDALNVAQTGLIAAKTTVENVMNNIANENTPGYKKRTVGLQELSHTDSRVVGRGVLVGDVTRATSNYMFNNLINENTKESYLQKMSGALGGVESLFKETELSGFTSDLNRYFQSVENLRSNPDSEVFRNDMKTQGNTIVSSLSRLYNGLDEQENMLQESLEDDIETVNSILKDIGKINEQLGQEIEASNDLLDRRDRLEEELSRYIDIEVNRTSDDYELKVAGTTAVRHSTNIREINLVEEFVPQVDRYINDDFVTKNIPASNILNGVDFDDGDVVNFKLDNESSISVEFGERVKDIDGNYVDINNDGNIDINDSVDANNLVRALVYKINNSTDMLGKVEAFNGSYATDDNGNKITLDHVDHFLYVESTNPGTEGKFDSRITFVEKSQEIVPDPIEAPTIEGMSDSIKNEGNALLHNVSLSHASLDPQTYSFTITDDSTNGAEDYSVSGMTFTNGVLYDEATNELIVPAGVTDFSVSIPTVPDAASGSVDTFNEQFTLTISDLDGANSITATATIIDESSSPQISGITKASVQEGETLVHTVDLSGEIPNSSGLDYALSFINMNNVEDVDLGEVTFQSDTGAPITLSDDGVLNIPFGVKSFEIHVPTTADSFHELDENYEMSISDNFGNELTTTGTIINDDTAVSYIMYKNEGQSTKAENIAGLSIYDRTIPVSSGSMKAQVENMNSESSSNLLQKYKDQLDAFAKTLSDLTDQYMRDGDDGYIYGESAVDDISHQDGSLIDNNIFQLGLFTGSDVKTLQFNQQAVNDLDQNDLDYLATMQFKDDIYFNGKPQGSTHSQYEDSGKTTFSDYFQSVRVGIATDKENNDFLKETQETVKQSIQNSYDKIVKVDGDEEMINLIKFQAAYTANAKIITVVDEMLNTLLGMKR